MFRKSKILQSNIVIALVAMMLFGGILLPNTTPAAFAQSLDTLSGTLTGPAYVTPGSDITYEITLQNATSQPITTIDVFSSLPANTTYVSGGTFDGTQITFPTVDSLAAFATLKFTFVVNVSSNLAVGTVIVNDAAGYYFGPEGDGFGLPPLGTTLEAAGTLTAVYKNANGTPFNVAVNGFGFKNYGGQPPRVSTDDLDKNDVFAFFGPAACQSGTTAATCVLSGPAQKWLDTRIAAMSGGHCEGLAITSLRFFNALPFKGKSTPASFQAGAAQTADLTFPAQSIENYIGYYFTTQAFREVSASRFKAGPVEIVNKLIADFNAATPIAYTVAIYIVPGFKNGHAVTAYGVETVSPTESRILVYDNNYPKQRQYITVNMAANTWRYVTSSVPGQPASVYSGTATSANLSIAPLSSRDLPAGQYFACPFCNLPASSGSVQATAAGLISGDISFQYTGEGAILVTNDAGQKTGLELGSDTLLEEIPGTELIHYTGGLGQDVPPHITVPFAETDETFYTVVVHGTTVTTPTHGALSIVGPGFHMGVDSIALDPNEVLTFTISPDGDHISFTASETVTAPAIHIAHDPINPGDPSVIFEVTDEVLFEGETISLNLDPVLERIEFDDTGLEEEDFNVAMDLIFPDGDTHVYTETVIVPAGSTSALIDFGAWDGQLIPPTYIDNALQNPSVNHRLKLTNSTVVYDAAPQANAPAGVYHVAATFENVTEISLENVYFTVANLGAGAVVLNADSGPTGTGAKISVPAASLGDDSILHTHDTFTFTFDVGVTATGAVDLTVDANGVPHDWIHPNPAPAYDANNASFVFTPGAIKSLFLPLVAR